MNTDYQMTPAHDTAAVTATKLTVVWAGVAVAAVLASIYSGILIVEKVARVAAEILRSRDK